MQVDTGMVGVEEVVEEAVVEEAQGSEPCLD